MAAQGDMAARELMERWFAAWNDHDPQRIADLMTDDVLVGHRLQHLAAWRKRRA